MKHEKDQMWASGVFIKTPTQVVLVSEDLGKVPIYKKIPGGRRRPADKTKEDTALREALEETGIRLEPGDLRHVMSQPRGNHVYHLFTAVVAEERLAECYTVAKNGEYVHVIPCGELKFDEILPPHLTMLRSHNLLAA